MISQQLTGKTYEFAVACYEMNSIKELAAALRTRRAGAVDCRNWKIRPREWRIAIKTALIEKLAQDCDATQ